MMRTRFAPSPTGFLHLGHVYSACMCRKVAQEGELLLRFEDIDHTRVREHYYSGILEDLSWLGISFQPSPWRQLERMNHYHEVLTHLIENKMVYPCFCTRKQLAEVGSLSAPQGEKAPLYGGRCRGLSASERRRRMESDEPYCWRLDAALMHTQVGDLSFIDAFKGEFKVSAEVLGDVVIARKDIRTSYHLAVVIDDEAQGVTDVVRGEDLLESTHVHRLLQEFLGFRTPQYHHHRLICDAQGKRLAKRHDALSVKELREGGASPEEVIRMVLPLEG